VGHSKPFIWFKRRLRGSLLQLNFHYISAVVGFVKAVFHDFSLYIEIKFENNKTEGLTGRKNVIENK
jgi:hypothetical protein